MRIVHQRHSNGCAIACMAMLTGISYDSVFKAVHGKRNKPKEYPGLSLEVILRTLDKLRINYRVSFDKKDWKNSKNNSMMVVDYGSKPDKTFDHCRHAVVWNAANKSIIDPMPRNKRKLDMTNSYCTKNFSLIIEVL